MKLHIINYSGGQIYVDKTKNTPKKLYYDNFTKKVHRVKGNKVYEKSEHTWEVIAQSENLDLNVLYIENLDMYEKLRVKMINSNNNSAVISGYLLAVDEIELMMKDFKFTHQNMLEAIAFGGTTVAMKESLTSDKAEDHIRSVTVPNTIELQTTCTSCPSCGEHENLHINYHSNMISEILCNECGDFFEPEIETYMLNSKLYAKKYDK